ncbi:MAG: hypothetical protein ACKVP0_21280, partial [Pirellulaceae bacterium]
MRRSSKQRRQNVVRRWKRALFVAACAASLATSSFLWAEETAPVKKKLPTKSVTPVAVVGKEGAAGWWNERPAPIVRPSDAKRAAALSEAPPEPSSRKSPSGSPAKLLGAKVSPFRPVAIEAVPSQTEAKRTSESRPEETLAPIVTASSLSRPGQKTVAQTPAELTPVEPKGASADRQQVAAAPLSPWMQDVRASQSEATTPNEESAPTAPAGILKSGSSPFRPVAIQAIPAQMEDGEGQAAAPAPLLVKLSAAPKPEVKAKPIPSKLKPVEQPPEETLAPIVAASSISRPSLKPVEQKPLKSDDAPAPEIASQEPAAPAKLPTVGLSIFQRAAMPALPEAEVAAAEVPEQTPEEPAEQAPPQDLAPIVQARQAVPLVQAAPEPKRLALPAKPLRAKPPARNESKSEPLVIAVQNEAAQPKAAQPADPLPAPDRDADLKKHFEVIQQSGEFSVQVHRSKLLRTAKD